MWTIQEFAMAKKQLIMCGEKIITWQELITGVDYHNALLRSRNDSLTAAERPISVAGFFWHSLYRKEEYSAEKIEQSYRWPLRIFDAGDLQSSVDRIHKVKYI